MSRERRTQKPPEQNPSAVDLTVLTEKAVLDTFARQLRRLNNGELRKLHEAFKAEELDARAVAGAAQENWKRATDPLTGFLELLGGAVLGMPVDEWLRTTPKAASIGAAATAVAKGAVLAERGIRHSSAQIDLNKIQKLRTTVEEELTHRNLAFDKA